MSEDVALYARVSTENQDLERQVQKLKDWAEKENYNAYLYKEKISGKDDDREKFQEMMDKVAQGAYSIVAVTKIDRFGRSTRHILQNIDQVEKSGAAFVTTEQPIDTRDDSMMGDIMTQLLSMFADFERRMIRERMEEGFREAQKEGRVGNSRKLTDEQVEEMRQNYEDGWSIKQVHSWVMGRPDFPDKVSYQTIRNAVRGRGVYSDDK